MNISSEVCQDGIIKERILDYWKHMEPTNKYIAVSLNTLVDLLIEREFYLLDQKKDKYQDYLKRLLNWRHGRIIENLDCWNHMDPTNRCIATSFNTLVELFIKRELYQLSQEKEKSGNSDDNDQNI